MEFIAKDTEILQLCLVSGPGPAAQMEQLQGNKMQPPVGQMVLRGGLGAHSDREQSRGTETQHKSRRMAGQGS